MDYNTLKTAVSDWMHRGTTLDSKIDSFIDLFEARANTALRTPEMEVLSTATPTTKYMAFPSGFLELRSIQINTSPPTLLEYASPQKINALKLTGDAAYYTVINNQLLINPGAANTEVEISYYQSLPALSATTLTNWLITNHENYYLMGTIQQAMLYARYPNYSALDQQLLGMEAMINKRGRGKRYGPGPLVISAI